ncbi:hypothetical protein J7J58_00430 [candidate division WOR-3 bacterium]|nr:hypothetical protein [candidate division WOR-3 bacterium]
MNRNYLAKIEERLAILEEICDNSDLILNETERNFIKEEIEEQIREMNVIFHSEKFNDRKMADKFLSLITIYNQKVMNARNEGIIENEHINIIPVDEELE